MPGSKAKKPRTARSQPPACSHKEHDILTTAEATAFAAQFWDQKMYPTKASQHEFLATCIDVGDVCPNGVTALPEKSNADSDSDSE